MCAGIRVDELYVEAQPIAGTLNAAFQHIPHVQFAPDLLQVDMFAFVSEGGIASDHERTRNAREIGGETLCDAIDKIFLLRIAADIVERKNNDREAWRTRLVEYGVLWRDG